MQAEEKIMVTRPFLPPKAEFDDLANEVWKSHRLTNQGSYHRQLAQELVAYLGTANINLMANGHLALEIALQGLAITDEVITTPFTFASTPHAITRSGLTPVFCDIREDDLTLNEDKIEALITPKTTAILPVHVYGHPCHCEKIEAVATKHGLRVIYDAAHAFGVKLCGKGIASYGNVSMFSFHATKLFHTIEGGALAYTDTTLSKPFGHLSNFGINGETQVDTVGGNAKMNEFQAIMGLTILPYIAQLIAERKTITEWYTTALSPLTGIRIPASSQKSVVPNYAYMPILIDEKTFGATRDDVYIRLKENNIFTRRYFYPLATEYGCYRKAYSDVHLPVAEKAARQALCLPLYNGLAYEDVMRICQLIQNIPS